MMPFNNIFNEWYAAQTSKKIRAVWKSKADRGERISPTIPYGYMKSGTDPKQWVIEEAVADVVRKIFSLCLAGMGPMKIANRLREEQILTPTTYFRSVGRPYSNKSATELYDWQQTTVRHILENRQYTGCTVNFKTSLVSYKVHKTVHNSEDDWQIIPNTQEAIIDEDTFNRVQELRQSRRRNTATGRTSLFSGLVYCGDCGSKLYFCAAKSIKENQEFYRCSAYKENRGTCSIHYIRDVVLRQAVLETVKRIAEYITQYEPVFLYMFARKNTLGREQGIRSMKTRLEQSKKRIKELDKLIERLYEDNVLGKVSDERFSRMTANYETEQKELISAVNNDEQAVRDAEKEKVDLRLFLETIRKCIDISELTPTLVNTLIKKIEVFDSEKIDGHKHVPIKIHFTAAGIINIPDENEILQVMEEIRTKPLKTA
jgi:site-specific DNA recombinase